MITKNEQKYYSSLLDKKFRFKEKKFIIDGKRIILEGLKSDYKCEIVLMNNSFAADNKDVINLAGKKNIRLEIVSNYEIEKLSDTKNPQGVIAVFLKKETEELCGDIIAVLHNISDPGNAGTIMRNCDWFGFKDIVLSENTVELYNPKVLRSGMGAIFHGNFTESHDFSALLKEYKLKGYKIITADTSGDNLFEFPFPEKFLIIFSNEAAGPSEEIINYSDYLLSIPRYGNAESLNVASASAVVLAEIAKKRKQLFPYK